MRTATRKKDNRTDIEAGSMLSECVINTKTIFSFNFQKPAVDMYLGLLLTESSSYISDCIWNYMFRFYDIETKVKWCKWKENEGVVEYPEFPDNQFYGLK